MERIFDWFNKIKAKLFGIALFTITSLCIVMLYSVAVFVGKVEASEYARNIALFNITFSIGLGALIIAAGSLLDNTKLEEVRAQVITYLNEFVGFSLLNLLVILASYTYIDYFIHITLIAALIANIIVIWSTRSLFKIFHSKVT
ncbi:hypothetical protein [Halobacillus sp. A5]|uniref:hypothetical protein n=1 Tax=Halobacillus sp. A5 TaxID=2880263 RepID=UPI0020A6D0F1|nr:hypothetical protein [Halobacillus sp. A5]MCP3026625.1 hypothetical protein [Halobacillus sp. A5]